MNEMFALRVNIIFLFHCRFVYVQKERGSAVWLSACEHKKHCFINTRPVRGYCYFGTSILAMSNAENVYQPED